MYSMYLRPRSLIVTHGSAVIAAPKSACVRRDATVTSSLTFTVVCTMKRRVVHINTRNS